MCILIEQSEGQHFTFSQVLDFYEHNPDGFGAFDPATGEVERLPGGDVKKIYKLYRDKYAGRHCLLHFRLATSGAHDLVNVHPFEVGSDWVLFHNGVLDGNLWKPYATKKDKHTNDTRDRKSVV